MAEDLDLEFHSWFQDAARKVQGGQQAMETEKEKPDSDEFEEVGEE